MRFLLITYLLLSSFGVIAQQWKTLDATLQSRLSDKSLTHHEQFQRIVSKGKEYGYQHRLDSIPYNYVFIKQRLRDYDPQKLVVILGWEDYDDTIPSPIDVIECYFLGSDTTQSIVYYNGIKEDNTEYRRNLNSFLEAYSSYQAEQTLDYSKTQNYSAGCIARKNEKELATENRSKQLQNTYQIMTYIDSKKQKSQTSFQLPPKNPDFILSITHGF